MWILYLEEMWELEEAHEGEVSPVGPAVDGHPVDVHVRVIATQPRQDLDLKRKKPVCSNIFRNPTNLN